MVEHIILSETLRQAKKKESIKGREREEERKRKRETDLRFPQNNKNSSTYFFNSSPLKSSISERTL